MYFIIKFASYLIMEDDTSKEQLNLDALYD